MLSRRKFGKNILSQLVGISLASTLGGRAFAQQQSIRIGYQKYGTLALLKDQKILEKSLDPKGISVQWALFPAGPPLLQALIAGALDFGSAGDLPPIFAQASSPGSMVYVGHETPAGASEAIIVPQNSAITTIKDLQGKSIAVTRGSDAHWLLLAALKNNGLSLNDVKVSYLLPAAARPAFEGGKVDAWAIWDPYLSGVSSPVRVLATGEDVQGGTEFYLASKEFYQKSPELLHEVTNAIAQCDIWMESHKAEVAAILAHSTGLELDVVTRSIAKIHYGYHPITHPVIASQQHIADTFAAAGLLPSAPNVQDAAPEI